MTDQRLGAAFRAVRIRRGQRQRDVAETARVSPTTVSRLERGHLGTMSIDRIRAVGAALDIRVDIVARWRGGDLDRLVSARHSALHEAVARWFTAHAAWSLASETSFSIYGERGVIDLLAWQAEFRALLVIELKSELIDVQGLIGSVDRKRRLAASVVRERGWDPATVSAWVILAESRTNRRHVAGHTRVLRTAFPANGHALRAWLSRPDAPIAGLSFLPYGPGRNLRRGLATPHRVRGPSHPPGRPLPSVMQPHGDRMAGAQPGSDRNDPASVPPTTE